MFEKRLSELIEARQEKRFRPCFGYSAQKINQDSEKVNYKTLQRVVK